MVDEDEFTSDGERKTEELAEELQRALEVLGWTPAALADRMVSLGDYRPAKSILRGINRALTGQVKVPGELLALVHQMVRFKFCLKRIYGNAVWMQLKDGSHTAKLEDFIITLIPKSKGRWKVTMIHKNGFSPSWSRCQENLDEAKSMAFIILDDAQHWLSRSQEERDSVTILDAPNETTAKTLRESRLGVDVHHAKNANDLFAELGVSK